MRTEFQVIWEIESEQNKREVPASAPHSPWIRKGRMFLLQSLGKVRCCSKYVSKSEGNGVQGKHAVLRPVTMSVPSGGSQVNAGHLEDKFRSKGVKADNGENIAQLAEDWPAGWNNSPVRCLFLLIFLETFCRGGYKKTHKFQNRWSKLVLVLEVRNLSQVSSKAKWKAVFQDI